MIVKCQYTRIEFEAESSRTKNHPAVSAFLSEAAKENGHYRGASHTAKTLVVEASGYDNIDELMTDVRAAYASWKETGESRKVTKSQKQMAAEYRERQDAWRRGAEQREADASNRHGTGATPSKDPVEDW